MKLTVFTPTYNRADCLRILYKSLSCQSSLSFNWLVVDDGSTDDTEILIEKLSKKAPFSIEYHKKENGGKHTAINIGVEICKDEWIYIVDSDDVLPPNAIQQMLTFIEEVDNDHTFCGVSGERYWLDGIPAVSGGPAFDVLDSDSVEIRERYGFVGDFAECWRVSVLKSYPFPVFEGERFVSEGLIWSRMATKYKVRYHNANTYMGERRDDGLVRNMKTIMRKSPYGTMLFYAECAADKRRKMLNRIKAAINYWRYTLFLEVERKDMFHLPFWGSFLIPVGCVFLFMDYIKR